MTFSLLQQLESTGAMLSRARWMSKQCGANLKTLIIQGSGQQSAKYRRCAGRIRCHRQTNIEEGMDGKFLQQERVHSFRGRNTGLDNIMELCEHE
jgi:hypothetical protein